MKKYLLICFLSFSCIGNYDKCGKVISCTQYSYEVEFKDLSNNVTPLKFTIKTNKPDTIKVGSKICINYSN